jgi:hypothetical protein
MGEEEEEVAVYLVGSEHRWHRTKVWMKEMPRKYSKLRFVESVASTYDAEESGVAVIEESKELIRACDAMIINWSEGAPSVAVHWEHAIAWFNDVPVGVLVSDAIDPEEDLHKFMYHHADVVHHNTDVIVAKLFDLVQA